MFKPVLRLTLITFVWRRYKRNILITLAAFIATVLVTIIHSDYLAYLNQTGQTANIGWSFVVKWLLYLLIIALWIATLSLHKTSRSTTFKRPSHSEIRDTASRRKEKGPSQGDDPFAHIRNKKQLHSRGDQVIEHKK
ncbi:hypothetical protein HMF8227_00424 [Saliniradius amylolyticus]|uniref:Uncharacterized protein n=1 Tax=Saliniradius amylolyticus TaxID=2183582 RepID=A0A2S2DZV6_9ALTE|nr:hypothetical protein [Saliniradius amylolyticus]AWL10921.1 hypothetical protein HMF8227_00424 [Saliniradius amylolyticus]